jgi:hypothetical protein
VNVNRASTISSHIYLAITGCHIAINTSRQSVWVWVWVGTQPLLNRLSRLIMKCKCQSQSEFMEVFKLSELRGMSAGCPVGSTADSYNTLVFAA